jgi:hypothetical protein
MAVLLAAYLVAYLGRSSMALSAAFSTQLALALLTEAAASPLGALVDAAVMASATDVGGGRDRGVVHSGACRGGACVPAGSLQAHVHLNVYDTCTQLWHGPQHPPPPT